MSPLTQVRMRVLALLKRYGHNTTCFQILEPGLDYWFDGDDACIGYCDTGGAWVVAGAPVAPVEREIEVFERFLAAAHARGRRVRFFCVEKDLSDELGLAHLHIGDQPVWDPAEWDAVLRSKRSLREQLRRARAKGVVVRAVSPEELGDTASPVRQKIDAMIEHWMSSRAMAPMGFVVHLDPYSLPEERRFFVAERGDAVMGILAAVPIYAREGWFFEDVLRDPEAPNGTIELLFDHAMRDIHALGSRHVTFGLAPLAGTEHKVLRFIRDHTAWLYDFEGLRRFKAKLKPTDWEAVFMAYPSRERGIRATVDILAAFARGSFIKFGIQTLIHKASAVTRLLALLLIPWTLLLAFAPAEWFPSPEVQRGWLALDCVLFASLMWLASRWRKPLAIALSLAAATDFTLGVVQAAAYNADHASGYLDWMLIVMALAAPLFASVFLWVSRDRERRYRVTA